MAKDVPSNRPEIYRECAVLMFERWDPDRGVLVAIPRNFDRLQLFSELASQIYGKPEYAAGVELSWLEKSIRGFFEKLYEDRSRAIEATKSLIKFIVGRAWVMSEVGDKVFNFTHQTFLEYFFAKHIDDSCDSVAEVFAIIEPKILKREWDVVAHLSLQLKTFRNLRRQDAALETLKTLVKGQHGDKEHAAVTSFSARSLEYLVGTEAAIRGLVEEILDTAMGRIEAKHPSVFEDAARCLQCAPERVDVVKNAFVNKFSNWVCSDNSRRRRIAANVIDEDTTIRLKMYRHSDRRSAVFPVEVISEVKSRCKDYLLRHSLSDASCAVTSWKWYGAIDDKLVRKFGLGMYFRNPLPGGISEVDGVTSIILCASDDYHGVFSDIARSVAVDAMRTFGRIGFAGGSFSRSEFAAKFDNLPPVSVWESWLDEFSRRPAELACVYFALLVLVEAYPKYEIRLIEEGSKSGKGKAPVDNIISLLDLMARADSLRTVSYYPAIKRVIDGEARILT